MLVALVLGMGLPTTAAYVLTSISAAPVLLLIGVNMLSAHMFVFYFGVMSALTPPVATGAFTAAAIAQANPTKLMLLATRMALSGFFIPFMFIYDSNLLITESFVPLLGALSFVSVAFGITAVSAVFEGCFVGGRLSPLEVLFMVIGTALTFYTNPISKLFGMIIIVAVAINNYKKYNAKKESYV